MFSYFGSKSKIIHLYPKPKHDKIIECFAGSARYALKYFDRDILISDKYDVIVRIWKWLQQCSPNDILKLPKLKRGMDLRKMDLSDEERLYLGFLAAGACGTPRNIVTPFGDDQFNYQTIANNLFKIKHWTIIQSDYLNIPNQNATWFIDAPYQYGGEHQYKFKNKHLDFDVLRDFCLSREGQTIVCENTKATWLQFAPLVKIQGVANTKTTEAIWTNEKTSYNCKNLDIFNS